MHLVTSPDLAGIAERRSPIRRVSGCFAIHAGSETGAPAEVSRCTRDGWIWTLNLPAFFLTLAGMSKFRNPATGEGYLGEIMVHKLSRAVGIVDNVVEAKDGWPPQITLKLKDGSFKRGKLSDFREPHAAEREQITAA